MSKGTLSMKYAVPVIVIMQTCDSIIFGFDKSTGTDMWISIILAAILSIPLLLLFARLIELMPGKDIFEMAEQHLGRVGMIIVAILFMFYSINMSASIRGYYAEFMRITALTHTPFVIILFSFFIICTYLAKSGMTTFGKWSRLIIGGVFIIHIILSLLSIPKIDLGNLMPFIKSDTSEILQNATHGVFKSLGECVLLLGVAGNLEKTVKPYKLFLLSMVISSVFFLIVYTQNLTLLGETALMSTYFPYFKWASIIDIGTIGTRIESLVTFTFLLVGITKVAIGLMVCATALARILRLKTNSSLVIPISYFSIALSVIIFHSFADAFSFVEIVDIYAFPYQVIIPLIIWIIAEIKNAVKKPKELATTS